eukprot:3452808-Pleurochrysis_carterae.AAC.1
MRRDGRRGGGRPAAPERAAAQADGQDGAQAGGQADGRDGGEADGGGAGGGAGVDADTTPFRPADAGAEPPPSHLPLSFRRLRAPGRARAPSTPSSTCARRRSGRSSATTSPAYGTSSIPYPKVYAEATGLRQCRSCLPTW